MSTAREQAREAVSANWHGSSLTRHPDRMADAASDVWEPLLRDLHDEIMAEITSGQYSAPSSAVWDAIVRAYVALHERQPLPAAVTGRCSECERPVYTPLDEKETRCAGCVKKEQDAKSSSSAVPKGFWDRTQRS